MKLMTEYALNVIIGSVSLIQVQTTSVQKCSSPSFKYNWTILKAKKNQCYLLVLCKIKKKHSEISFTKFLPFGNVAIIIYNLHFGFALTKRNQGGSGYPFKFQQILTWAYSWHIGDAISKKKNFKNSKLMSKHFGFNLDTQNENVSYCKS